LLRAEALPEAKGVSLGDGADNVKGRGGRSLSYVATMQGNGTLLVGKAYGMKRPPSGRTSWI
jgi:hypothetical protein